MKLTDEQLEAVRLATDPSHALGVLTGGPGTGKTTTVRALLDRAGELGQRVALAAPSGKAAARLAEATGREASTIHRLLGLRPDDPEAWEPVRADLLVIDEASMVDSELMAQALSAARFSRARVILVGDVDQLPPVGPGQDFADLVASETCPTARLTIVQRQALESGIVRAAHSIREGCEPDFGAPDCQILDVEDTGDIPAAIWALIKRERLVPATSQVVAPQKTTAAGVNALNAFIEAARPFDGAPPPLVRKQFRMGTKVIQTRNDYDLGVFNGELGYVLEARDGGERRRYDELVVHFEGREEPERLRGGQLKNLAPAWALTVHRSQGSEADDVIVVADGSHRRMLTRRLLYVAVTRAKQRLWVVGQREAVAKAVRNTRDARRKTLLSALFREGEVDRELEAAAS